MIVRHVIHRGRVLRFLAAASLVLGATTVSAVATPALAQAEEFAPSGAASIYPGVMMDSLEGQCTANFVFRGDGKLYLGQAAHCTGTGNADEVDGCKAKSLPLGTEIKIQGASKPGKLAYNSWLAMQEQDETDPNLCMYNDFALVEIDPADEAKVNPSVPKYGGPVGVRQAGLPAGAKVYSYQNSSLRIGAEPLSPKEGLNLRDDGDGRSHEVATITPGVPGDSGSGFLDADGNALGILSTLNLSPAPGTNGVADLGKALAYANDHGGDFSLVKGTEPFRGGLLPSVPLAGPPTDASKRSEDVQRAAPNTPTEPLAVNPKRDDPVSSADFNRGRQAPEVPNDVPQPVQQNAQPKLIGGL